MQLFMDSIRNGAYCGSASLNRLGQLLAAGLIGFGAIVLVAANWDGITTFQRFGIAGALICTGVIVAMALPRLGAAALLVSFAATGGMLALIGQTYQTGADPWQLFAYWAALGVPFALAARSDAVWSPWVLVSATAIGLWGMTSGFFEPFGRQAVPSLGLPYHVAVSWLLMIGLAAVMAGGAQLDRLMGSRKWAGRIALLLALGQVAAHGIEAVLAYRPHLTVYLAAIAACAAIGWRLLSKPARDLMMIAACALAVDALLIAGLGRLLLDKRGDQTLGFIVMGLVAAGIVAASVVGIMRLIEPNKAAAVAGMSKRPWPVVLLSGIGAMMAAIPFLVAFVLLFGTAIDKGPLVYLFGIGAAAAAVTVLRQPRGLFVEQLAVVGLVTGLLLLTWGIFRDLPLGMAGLVTSALTIGLAFTINRPWLAALLAAASTAALATALVIGLRLGVTAPGLSIAWSLIACAGLAASAGLRGQMQWLEPLRREDDSAAGTAEAAVNGWLAGALAGLAVSQGMTFMFGAGILGGANPTISASGPLMTARAVSCVLAAVAMAYLWRAAPAFRSHVAAAIMVAAVVLSLAMPSLGATVLVLAAAVMSGKRTLAVLAVVSLLWIVGAFYYNLALPLTHKGVILIAVGAMLGLVATFSVEDAREVRRAPEADASPYMTARALAAAGLLLTGYVSIDAIQAKERLIRDGKPVFVELAPVDPRSIMQGDYMALRFRLPPEALRHPDTGAKPHVVGRIDEKGVLRLTHVSDAQAKLGADEMRIELSRKRGQWMIVTDAWYFKEGTAKKWEAARYGELRVTADGNALLVGLADKDLVAIKK